ncbi:hypothetical protein GCM10009662_68450 [Catellatospora coxensis]
MSHLDQRLQDRADAAVLPGDQVLGVPLVAVVAVGDQWQQQRPGDGAEADVAEAAEVEPVLGGQRVAQRDLLGVVGQVAAERVVDGHGGDEFVEVGQPGAHPYAEHGRGGAEDVEQVRRGGRGVGGRCEGAAGLVQDPLQAGHRPDDLGRSAGGHDRQHAVGLVADAQRGQRAAAAYVLLERVA